MPLYTVMTQAGALSGEAKAKLAGELTTLHSEYAGVPKNWVHIVFQDYAPGSGFTAGEASATAALTLLVRTGRFGSTPPHTLLKSPLETGHGDGTRWRRFRECHRRLTLGFGITAERIAK
jgi:phenylpyruvate tautomerase PptA (4-oxalocrotonate tautomerase family)